MNVIMGMLPNITLNYFHANVYVDITLLFHFTLTQIFYFAQSISFLKQAATVNRKVIATLLFYQLTFTNKVEYLHLLLFQ